MEICRVFTFYNYQNPIMIDRRDEGQYTTIGVFDGMRTDAIEEFEKEELKSVWLYGLKETARNQGRYSYQNIFCFSNDAWNKYSDNFFWDEETNKDYPLCFVIFLQMKNYSVGENSIQQQCEKMNVVINDKIADAGICYIYSTIDKNDYVVCIKCKNYDKATEIIKSLYEINFQIVYSFSTLSICNNVLDDIENDRYGYLFEQNLDSICLKGCINSFDTPIQYSLNNKYSDFCKKLIKRLYDGEDIKEKENNGEFRIYDILGVDDFRLIARNINLGKLLKQFAKGNLLCCEENIYKFNFFSSNIALNIIADESEEIEQSYIDEEVLRMQRKYQVLGCNKIENEMVEIRKRIELDRTLQDEKMLNICYALWQMLQSLKSLEFSLAKKYDFWSIYQSFELLIRILEEKLKYIDEANIDHAEITEHEEIYDFFNKINMILQSNLRMDIPFFHNRGFNVIVNYVPVKLRAFYSIWALKVSKYYNDFVTEENKNEYSFILSPGMYREASVKQLYDTYEQNKRLMLITVPEKYLYTPKCLLIILSHEVSHYVGKIVRNREKRHQVWVGCIARILELEFNFLRFQVSGKEYEEYIEAGIKEKLLYETFNELLLKEELLVREKKGLGKYTFHSNNSFRIIVEAFFNMSEKYMKKIIMDDCCYISKYLIDEKVDKKLRAEEKYRLVEEIRSISYGIVDQMNNMQRLFLNKLKDILGIIKHITTEGHADLNAILTLDLTPEEYIFSFANSELDESELNRAKENEGSIDIIRMAYTMEAVNRGVKKWPQYFGNKDFCQEWSYTPIEKLIRNKDKDSPEYKMAYKIKGFKDKIDNQNNSISEYRSLYNYDKKAFINTELDFLADSKIWDLICLYMDECVFSYLDGLNNQKEIEGLQEQKEKLNMTFRNVSQSGMSVLQEIEDFLKGYDEESKNELKIS